MDPRHDIPAKVRPTHNRARGARHGTKAEANQPLGLALLLATSRALARSTQGEMTAIANQRTDRELAPQLLKTSSVRTRAEIAALGYKQPPSATVCGTFRRPRTPRGQTR